MNHEDAYLNGLLAQYRKQLKDQKRELKSMPPGYLALDKQKGRTQCMQIIPASKTSQGKRIRKGITKDEVLVRRLARKKFLEKSNLLLTNEIAWLEDFLAKHREPSAGNVLAMLPASYRELPEDIFFPEKRKAQAWAREPYPQNTSYLHEKKHITARGLRVRSKSELIIAEKLDHFEIPYRYDALFRFGNHTFSPDFSFMTKEGVWYWEHCGMMLDLGYRYRNRQKLSNYERMGIAPWKNLIVTYDTEDGAINSAVIEAEIKNKLLLVM